MPATLGRMGITGGEEGMQLDSANGPQDALQAVDIYAQLKGQHEIREVWTHNLEDEIQIIQDVVHQYQYIAMVHAKPEASRAHS